MNNSVPYGFPRVVNLGDPRADFDRATPPGKEILEPQFDGGGLMNDPQPNSRHLLNRSTDLGTLG
jgi:hypothetical protein